MCIYLILFPFLWNSIAVFVESLARNASKKELKFSDR